MLPVDKKKREILNQADLIPFYKRTT